MTEFDFLLILNSSIGNVRAMESLESLPTIPLNRSKGSGRRIQEA